MWSKDELGARLTWISAHLGRAYNNSRNATLSDMDRQAHIEMPTGVWLSSYLWTLLAVLCLVILASKLAKPEGLRTFLDSISVKASKVKRALQEIERKTFHSLGVLVPLWYQTMTENLGFSEAFCIKVCWIVVTVVWTSEVLRLNFPMVQKAFMATPLGAVMREREQTQMTGTPFFVLGCTLSISLFVKEVAIASILFLILGDMTAALVGVSFGGEQVVVKLGRDRKKSVEGSLAMLIVCFIIGTTMFATVHLCEYAILVGAIVATLTELWSEDYLFGLNDNLTIPVFSALALTWAFQRTANCANCAPIA